MKIIDRLTNDQLNELYSNYNYDNMIIRDKYGNVLYRIPRMLAIRFEELSYVNATFKDKDGYVYSKSHANSHVKYFTDLSIQELFDLCILHINDTNDRPKCAECGIPIGFSRFTAGYGSGGHPWNESPVHFCSRSCAANFQFNNPDIYPLTAEFISSGGTFGNMSEELFTNTLIESRRSAFINQGNPDDQCYLYVAWTVNGILKFGISADSLDYRLETSGLHVQYTSIHQLKKLNSRVIIADLEAQIKYHFRIYNEYLDNTKFDEFWKFIKNIL